MVLAVVTLMLVAAALGVSGEGSIGLRWLLVVSALVAAIAASYLWWVFGVRVDAADTFSTPPPAAEHTGSVGVLFVFSAASFVVAGIFRLSRRPGAVHSV